ncbi:F-box only protein 12-like [Lolium perenne]|uniref:F-box only protein 12-like n=1 Tax=Lolium perenne TaxID=4522 RepID=UPI003A99EF08
MASPPQRLCRDLRSTTTAISRSRDVIVEILSWLPAKPLCQFRCVSREWHALISSRAFAAMHRSRAEPLLVGMSTSVSGTTNLQLMDTDGSVVRRFPPREGNWTLWASLDDLACISSSSGRSSTLEVVDLSTGKALLPAEDAAAGFLMYASCGRAARTGSLKVFRLDAHLTCEVLSLGDGASRWRQVQSPPPMVSHWNKITSSSVVTLHGALHFLSQDHYDVLSFDLDNETWTVIPGPPAGIVGSKKSISLAELNGTLCMARREYPLVADIWLLTNTDNSSWIKAYSLPVDLLADFVVPLRLLRLGGEVLFYSSYDERSKLVLQVYDPRSGKCRKVKTSTNLMGRIGLCSSSLVPPFGAMS